MTDKQIIVDVTQCPYHKEDKTCTYLPYKSKCEGDCNWTAYKEMEEQLDQLKAENDELKKEINNKYSVSNFNVIFMREHIHNLKAIITEIKEIAEENDELLQGYHKEWANNKLILQKISEVEDVENN